MSGVGAAILPELSVDDVAGLRVGIVVSQWHSDITESLVARACARLGDWGLVPEVVRVPGAFELPVVTQELADDHDVVIALGVVIRGGTPHFDYVCQSVATGLASVALSTRTAIGFGLLTCDNEEQAHDRAGLPDSSEDKGYEAADAAVHTAVTLRHLRGKDDE